MAKHIFNQVALGLRDMHEINLIHRDLKPLNIFVCDDSEMPRVKIGDLELAVQIEPGDKIIQKVGTKGFMAPEVAQL